MRDLLLASSSHCHPGERLDHLAKAISAWAEGVSEVLFVPWARVDHEAYTSTTRDRLARLGLCITGLHEATDAADAIRRAEAVFVGGGNTFLLLDSLQRAGVLGLLRERVLAGELRYLGTSAGSNVACPTIQTTNDMPIVWPHDGPQALGLVDVQVNAHYVDADPTSTHQGETRLERLAEFHEHHATPVVGLREHGWLRVRGDDAVVEGAASAIAPAVLLRRGHPPQQLPAGTRLPSRMARASGGAA